MRVWGSYGGGAVSYREKPVASRPNTVTLDLKLPNECEIGIRKCLNDMNDMVYKNILLLV